MKNKKGETMKKQTKSDLQTIITELENFYHGSEGKDFFNQIESDRERFDFQDRIYYLYNDLQDKLDELEQEEKGPIEFKDIEVNVDRLKKLGIIKESK